LTAGSGITITNGSGAITIASSGGASAATPTALGTVYGNQTSGGGTPFLTALGYNAAASSTGANNVAIGTDALYSTTSSTQKTAVGYQSGYSGTTTSSGLTAIGYQAGYSDANIYGAFDANLYIGYRAGYNNTTPNAQTFIGVGAGFTKSGTGGLCTLVGSNAGYYLTTGTGNTCLGYGTMNNATTISYSVAIGDRCMGTGVATGTYNVGVGQVALQDLTSGTGLVAVGMQAMNKNTTGNSNTAVGQNALYSNTTASGATAVGYQALLNNTTGSGSTAVGFEALKANTSNNNNTAIGSSSLSTATGSANTACGDNSGYQLTSGSNNCFFGHYAYGSAATNSSEIVIGYNTVGKGGSTGFINPASGGVYQGNNSANWSTTSDRRLKKNIVDNNTGLEKLTQIQVRNFEYRVEDEITELPTHAAIKKSGVQLGVIAQELQAVLPECVKTESTGVMSVDADNLTWYMINAIKELKAEFDAYKASHP